MNVPATMAALGGDKVRWKLAELVTEALMVVFRRPGRARRRGVAGRAAAPRVRGSRPSRGGPGDSAEPGRVRRSRHGLIDGRDEVAQVLQALTEAQESGESGSVSAQFGFDFPDISTAAWRVAQASQAAPYFDYDWVIERARHYDSVDRYVGLEARFLEEISVGLGSATGDEGLDATVFAVRRIHGRLDIILQLHEALREDMEAYLGEAEPETEAE